MARRVTTVKPRDSVRHAREVMQEQRINQLPVVKDGMVVGIITDRDVRDACPSVFDFTPYGEKQPGHAVTDPSTITVDQVMTPDAATLAPHQSIFAAARLMGRQRIGAVPIVADGHLVGIITRSDLLRALVALGDPGATADA